MNDKKFGTWSTYYPNAYGRPKSKELYRNDSIFKFALISDVGKKVIELEAESGLSVTLSKRIEAFDNVFPLNMAMYVVKEKMPPVDATRKCLDSLLQMLALAGEDVDVRFWDTSRDIMVFKAFDRHKVMTMETRYTDNNILSEVTLQNDTLLMRKVFVDGSKSDYTVHFYHSNGQIAETQSFVDSTIQNGVWEAFYPNGKKKSSRIYVRGKLDGGLKEWNQEGVLTRKERYRNGESVD